MNAPRHLAPLLALLPGLIAGCAPPDTSAMFTTTHLDVVQGADATAQEMTAVIDGAQDSLRVALPALEHPEITDAIVAAWDRGVDVSVVSDVDRADDAGVLELEEAGVPLSLADGAVTYHDYAVDKEVTWSSESVTMSHAFAVADTRHIAAASRAGDTADGPRVVMSMTSEDLAEDLIDEHVQVFGGTDASSLTAYNSLAKSVTDNRWRYPTQTDLDLQMWFGPQERLTKRIVDAVYGARASVWVLSSDLCDEGLTRALQAKAAQDFDVKVVVGADFGTHSPALSDEFVQSTPDVKKTVVPDAGTLPTVVLVDYALDRTGGRNTARAFMLTHPLLSSSRLYYSTTVPTDQLIDGTLLVLEDYDEPSGMMLQLLDLVQEYRLLAEEL